MLWLGIWLCSQCSLENLEHFSGIMEGTNYILIKSRRFSNSGSRLSPIQWHADLWTDISPYFEIAPQHPLLQSLPPGRQMRIKHKYHMKFVFGVCMYSCFLSACGRCSFCGNSLEKNALSNSSDSSTRPFFSPGGGGSISLSGLTARIVPRVQDFWTTMGSPSLCALNKASLSGVSNIGVPIASDQVPGERRLSLEPPLMDHMLFLKRANKHFLFGPSNTWQRNTAVIIYPSSCSSLSI